MHEIPVEQNITHEKDWRTLPIGNTKRTMTRNEY